jgi:hypothetical protein
MTLRDLENALEFLRLVCARGDREEVLVKTVTNIENYVRKAKHDGGNASGTSALAGKV